MTARRKAKGRQPGGRSERPHVLIVCEGETEFNYFTSLKRRFSANWLTPKKADESNPKGIIKCADRERTLLVSRGENVETWVVFDAESVIDEDRRCYRQCIDKALGKKFQVANSSPCFEYWPLIHFSPGIIVIDPKEAKAELGKSGRIEGYKAPILPHDELWDIYITGKPSKAAEKRRLDLEELGENPRFSRPITYVDKLVDRLVEISKY